jgi:hypothetical protein
VTEDEFTDLEEDLLRAIARCYDLEMAELDHRVTDPFGHAATLHRAHARVKELRQEHTEALRMLEGGEDDGESTSEASLQQKAGDRR